MGTISVAVMVIFLWRMSFQKYLITAMFKGISRQLRVTLTTAFERHFTMEDFTDMDQHIGVKPAPAHLTYCMLLFISNKPSF